VQCFLALLCQSGGKLLIELPRLGGNAALARGFSLVAARELLSFKGVSWTFVPCACPRFRSADFFDLLLGGAKGVFEMGKVVAPIADFFLDTLDISRIEAAKDGNDRLAIAISRIAPMMTLWW